MAGAATIQRGGATTWQGTATQRGGGDSGGEGSQQWERRRGRRRGRRHRQQCKAAARGKRWDSKGFGPQAGSDSNGDRNRNSASYRQRQIWRGVTTVRRRVATVRIRPLKAEATTDSAPKWAATAATTGIGIWPPTGSNGFSGVTTVQRRGIGIWPPTGSGGFGGVQR